MRSFEFKVKNPLGLHARPAGMIASMVRNFNSKVTINYNGQSVAATRLMSLISMGIVCGSTIKVDIDGKDEVEEEKSLIELFNKCI